MIRVDIKMSIYVCRECGRDLIRTERIVSLIPSKPYSVKNLFDHVLNIVQYNKINEPRIDLRDIVKKYLHLDNIMTTFCK